MTSSFWTSLDTFITNMEDDTDSKSGTDLGQTTTVGAHAQWHRDNADAINKMQSAMGTKAAGILNRWVPIMTGSVNLSATAAGTYVAVNTIAEDTTAATAAYSIITQYIDIADYAATGWTPEFRIVANFQQNGTANAGTSVTTVGLYPVVPAGTTTAWIPTLGTLVSGSTAAQTGGAASSDNKVNSSVFSVPTADSYTMAAVVSVATRGGGGRVNMRLEYRYV